jgi:hypothetical protein
LKKYVGVLFLLWTGALIALYYVVQKPSLLNILAGLLDTLWTLLVAAILLFNAYGLGRRLLRAFRFKNQDSIDHLLLGWGIGLGALGLLGLLLAAVQLANKNLLTSIQFVLALFFLLAGDFHKLRLKFQELASHLNFSLGQSRVFTKIALGLPLVFAFLLTFVPPFEAFDAVFYHLAQPAMVLQQGGLHAVDAAPQFWFPNLTENIYLWALAMGSERAAQMIHLSWAVLAALLLWYWTLMIWNAEVSRKSLLLLAAMPALPMLASWAYADMALVYYAIAALYAFTKFRGTKASTWLAVMAVMSGLAMSVKYTSFVVPLSCGILLLLERPIRTAIGHALQFGAIAILTALPYYLRNAVLMGNPFYPFVFGGRFWDSFLADWFADQGTGIGWNLLQLILLPVNTLLGHRDANFFDGRMGPLFLILAPFTLWILVTRTRRDSAAGVSLLAIGVFCLFSFGAWTVGVINSSALWQSRLLFPALIPFAIPSALAWDSIKAFDTSRLRISFLFNALAVIVITLTLIDNTIFVLQRNPLAVAAGAQTREQYIERINPSYAALMTLMDELPVDASVNSLFEPRTYGLPRHTHPDAIVNNFAHDAYLYQTPVGILQHWKSEQYSYILVYERGLDFMSETATSKFPPATQKLLQDTLDNLTLVGQTPDNVYSIYKIP